MMTIDVGELAKANADALERALAARRRDLRRIPEDDDRHRRAEALSLIEGYTALLREPALPSPLRKPVRYCFKLVLPDGSWSINEKQLASPPSEGDVVGFEGCGDWRIQGSQFVGVKPAGKPPREFFVCAPAA